MKTSQKMQAVVKTLFKALFSAEINKMYFILIYHSRCNSNPGYFATPRIILDISKKWNYKS